MVKRKRRRRRTPVWRSEQEQGEIVDAFLKHQERGLPAQAIAKLVGAPLSSIYSWRAKATVAREQKLLRWGTPRSVDHAISLLVQGQAPHEELLEALFVFLVWKRWPTAPQNHRLGVTSCITSYLALKNKVGTVSELPREDQHLLLGYLRIDVLRRMCSAPDAVDFPNFKLWPVDEDGNNEFYFLGEAVKYLLSLDPKAKHRAERPSLEKAHRTAEEGLFSCGWRPSRKMFRQSWSDYAAATPFHFVEHFSSSLNLTLNPADDDFHIEIDALLAQLPSICRYFSQCKWACAKLRDALDGRVFANVSFPAFPETLDPHTVALVGADSI